MSNPIQINEKVRTWVSHQLEEMENEHLPLLKIFTLYREEFGECFPFRKLGFSSPIKAIKALGLDLRITENELGQKVLRRGGADVVETENKHAKITRHFPLQSSFSGQSRKNIEAENYSSSDLRNTGSNLNSDMNKNLPEETGTCRKRENVGDLIPFQGGYQLTFINHLMVPKSEILEFFTVYGAVVRFRIGTCAKDRCYIHYANQQEALDALNGLKENFLLHQLQISRDCLYRRVEEKLEKVEDTEIFPFEGTYHLTFTSQQYVDTTKINREFSEFGTVIEVASNFRRIEGRRRVFVKLCESSAALQALASLAGTYPDLGVARCCRSDRRRLEEDRRLLLPDRDNLYCITFRNTDRCGNAILTRPAVIQEFAKYGAVESVHQDSRNWCYVRYKTEAEAAAALAGPASGRPGGNNLPLPSLGPAHPPNHTKVRKYIPNPGKELDLELVISNYPFRYNRGKLRKLFPQVEKLHIREMIVEGTKAFAFGSCEDYPALLTAVHLYHGLEVRGRRLIVRAKVPRMHNRILEDIQKMQEAGVLSVNSSLDNLDSSQESDGEDATVPGQQDQNCSQQEHENQAGERLTAGRPIQLKENGRPEKLDSGRPKELSSGHPVELVVANFGPDTTEKELLELFRLHSVTQAEIHAPAPSEVADFSYAILQVPNLTLAERIISRYDGTQNLNSSGLVIEINN